MADKGKKQNTPEDNGFFSELLDRFKEKPLVFTGSFLILILVVIAFVFLPAIERSSGDNYSSIVFGSYDGIPIKYVPNNYLARQYEYLYNTYQSSINEQTADYLFRMIWQQAFERTVLHTAMLRQLEEAGYTPPETVVDRRMTEHPQLQENGSFSLAIYRQLSNTQRMALWREIQDSIIAERYITDLFYGLKPSQDEIDFFKSMASSQRGFEMAAFSIINYPLSEQLKFVADNPQLFRVIQLSKITIGSSEREARQVLASIQSGALSFEDAVTTHSQDSMAEQGGRMGSRMAYELAPEIPDADERELVVSLNKMEISPVVKVPSGWAIFRCEEAALPLDTNDSVFMDRIKNYIIYSERGRVDDYYISQAEELASLAKSGSFEKAASAYGLEVGRFGPLPINYGNAGAFGSNAALSSFQVRGLEYADETEYFWTVAFSTPLNTPSTPLVLGNYVVVLYPNKEQMADDADLDSVEDSLSDTLMSYTDTDFRNQILSSPKLKNQFNETFNKLFRPAQ